MADNQIIFGRKPVLEALRSERSLEKLYIDRGLKGEYEKEVRLLAKQRSIPISRVPQQTLHKWTKGNHQGVLALSGLIPYRSGDDLMEFLNENDQTMILILDHITDVRNMGAILRSAYFFGIDHVLVPAKGTAEINEDAMKTSAGALAHMHIYRTSNLMDLVDQMRNLGVHIASLESKGGKMIDKVELPRPLGLVIGGEGHGVTREMLKRSDTLVYIPERTNFDSLNVSVATGIALYELTK
jgi:23S rRNA (guanosine2251-2'-O)-methyltransferase